MHMNCLLAWEIYELCTLAEVSLCCLVQDVKNKMKKYLLAKSEKITNSTTA